MIRRYLLHKESKTCPFDSTRLFGYEQDRCAMVIQGNQHTDGSGYLQQHQNQRCLAKPRAVGRASTTAAKGIARDKATDEEIDNKEIRLLRKFSKKFDFSLILIYMLPLVKVTKLAKKQGDNNNFPLG